MSVLDPAPSIGIDPRRARWSYWDQLRADLALPRLVRLGVIAAEFALIVAAVRLINIETPLFELVMTLALGGFLVHHFLPGLLRGAFSGARSLVSGRWWGGGGGGWMGR